MWKFRWSRFSRPPEQFRRASKLEVETVEGLEWKGVKNGELLRRAVAGGFDAIVTMDGNLEFQQPLARQPFGVVLVRAASNRMMHLTHLVPLILTALLGLQPGELRLVGA